MPRFIFLRTAWMKHYKGVYKDLPVGGGSYISENADGGEVYNFLLIGRRYYGYAQIQNERSLRIERLGAAVENDKITNGTIIFFGRNPQTGGQYIIGWYENATLFRHAQRLGNKRRGNHPWDLATTEKENAYLVPEKD